MTNIENNLSQSLGLMSISHHLFFFTFINNIQTNFFFFLMIIHKGQDEKQAVLSHSIVDIILIIITITKSI
jgi:hypothetical protein